MHGEARIKYNKNTKNGTQYYFYIGFDNFSHKSFQKIRKTNELLRIITWWLMLRQLLHPIKAVFFHLESKLPPNLILIIPVKLTLLHEPKSVKALQRI